MKLKRLFALLLTVVAVINCVGCSATPSPDNTHAHVKAALATPLGYSYEEDWDDGYDEGYDDWYYDEPVYEEWDDTDYYGEEYYDSGYTEDYYDYDSDYVEDSYSEEPYEEEYYSEEYYGEEYYEPEPEYTPEPVANSLQDAVNNAVAQEQANYPSGTFAVGVFDIWDGWRSVAEFNAYTAIWSGCQVKNSFATWVMMHCEEQGIDIFTTYINGVSIYDLLYDTVAWSNVNNDNVNYRTLVDHFGIEGFANYQASIGGQYVDYYTIFGSTTIYQKLAEWQSSYGYMYGGSYYGSRLAELNSNTNFCYVAQGMGYNHWYQHKSGWCDDASYYCAGDTAIVDGRWLVSIQSMNADVSSVQRIAAAIEPYLY